MEKVKVKNYICRQGKVIDFELLTETEKQEVQKEILKKLIQAELHETPSGQ